MSRQDSSNLSDKVAIFASCLCGIHCLMTPFVAIFFPVLVEYFEGPYIHILLFLFVAPLALYSFLSQRIKHHQNYPLIFGMIGLVFLAIGIFGHELIEQWGGHLLAILVNITGSGLLVFAHYKNIQLCRCHSCHH